MFIYMYGISFDLLIYFLCAVICCIDASLLFQRLKTC